MNKLKFELIIAYYKRPLIVKNALDSILNLKYDNWHLTFIDDSGNTDFKETFLNYGFEENKIKYIPILMSDSDKITQGGSIFGKFINEAIKTSDSDVIILICDDDALNSNYLNVLNEYYQKNDEINWCYSHVKLYNPEVENYLEADKKPTDYDWSLNFSNLNAHTEPIFPFCNLDSSQVTFKRTALVENNIWYAYPLTKNLDADIFNKMSIKFGKCSFCGCYGQYKGWFNNQLGVRFRSGKGDFI